MHTYTPTYVHTANSYCALRRREARRCAAPDHSQLLEQVYMVRRAAAYQRRNRTCSVAAGTSASRGFAGWNTNSNDWLATSCLAFGLTVRRFPGLS